MQSFQMKNEGTVRLINHIKVKKQRHNFSRLLPGLVVCFLSCILNGLWLYIALMSSSSVAYSQNLPILGKPEAAVSTIFLQETHYVGPSYMPPKQPLWCFLLWYLSCCGTALCKYPSTSTSSSHFKNILLSRSIYESPAEYMTTLTASGLTL